MEFYLLFLTRLPMSTTLLKVYTPHNVFTLQTFLGSLAGFNPLFRHCVLIVTIADIGLARNQAC